MKDTKFLSVQIELENVNKDELMGTIDLGSVTLFCEGREYKLDIVDSTFNFDFEDCTISCNVAVDKDTFPVEIHKYDFEDLDFHHANFVGEVFIGGDFEGGVVSRTLFIKQDGCTMAIDLSDEDDGIIDSLREKFAI